MKASSKIKIKYCLYCGNDKLIFVTKRADGMPVLKCSVCGTMMVEYLEKNVEELYTLDYFQKKDINDDGYENYLSSPVANVLGKYAFSKMFSSGKINSHLDLGSADGSLLEIFKQEGIISKGLEISDEAVKISVEKDLDVKQSDLRSFPKDFSEFSIITSFDILEHVSNPKFVLQEVFKRLDKEGIFIFSTLSITREDSTDFWFNNALEHYVYYDQRSLSYIMTEIFGADNFGFIEMEVNGISEFWGFGKKSVATKEKKLLENIKTEKITEIDSKNSYLLSLFYNQLSKFQESLEIINNNKSHWLKAEYIKAKFYNNYFQGKYENAIRDFNDNKYALSAQDPVYWQAVTYAQEKLYEIKNKDLVSEYDMQIFRLRDDVFRYKNEVHLLRNSKVIGKIIKLREKIGKLKIKNIYKLPFYIVKFFYKKLKLRTSKLLPEKLKLFLRKIRTILLRTKSEIQKTSKEKSFKYKIVENTKWSESDYLVSVVIPYYNRADTIDDTLKSLGLQTFTNFETIIVDDGSIQKESIDKLVSLKKAGLNARVINQKNQGVAIARNTGVSNAFGKYIICLDSDDVIDPTFIEKSTLILETSPDSSLITTHRDDFGVLNERTINSKYNPLHLYDNNMVITAAQFRKEAWEVSGGYKSNIGYEDWEFWLSLGERGFWGRLLPEALFKYRTSMQSRYVDDKDVHWNNIKTIRALHPNYKKNVKKLLADKKYLKKKVEPKTALINMDSSGIYLQVKNNNPNVLLAISWMTFGGAETLIYNYCKEIKNKFNLSFITGLDSPNEWEYKFKEITQNIYHLPNLFEDKKLWLEFISNYINTRKIDVLHIIHTSFIFEVLPKIKERHPNLKVIVTMFNDRAEHFMHSVNNQKYIDVFTSDNSSVAKHYEKVINASKNIAVIPNGIDCYDQFNLALGDRETERGELDINKEDISVFFVGRLSEEKNPDVFLEVAKNILSNEKNKNIKFFVVGDGPMRPEIEKTVKDINNPNVKYLGYQSDVTRYLSTADIFVLPSSIEGFPLSILEAMAMNVATIASDVGAVSEVIESGVDGFVVPAGSSKDIEKTINHLITNIKLLEKIKVSAREKVLSKYSNKKLGDNYTKLYKEILK